MDLFRIPVEVPEMPWHTGYGQKNLFVGSCFTENIGAIMKSLNYDVDINPFGIVYNPVSISRSVEALVSGDLFTKENLFEHNGLYNSYMHHSRFSGKDTSQVLININSRIQSGHQYLKEAAFLLITLGTAWIFELLSTGEVVSNCHKVPAKEFRRFRLSVGEAVDSLRNALEKAWSLNPALKVIFTISPIRHMADGAMENQLSKSTLLLAADALVKGYGPNRCAYFPSYEIVIDELRDYRFYADDMIHISPVAEQYIWEKFEKSAIDNESREISKKISAINKALEHRPFNRETKEYFNFLEDTLKKVRTIQEKYPYIRLHKATQHLNDELESIRTGLAGSY